MTLRGLGDRWLAGEALDGVAFLQHVRVSITAGARLGAHGTVMLLLDLQPEPVYLVALDSGSDVKVRQSSLRRLAIG